MNICFVFEGGDVIKEVFIGDGLYINFDFLNGLVKVEVIIVVIDWLEKEGIGSCKIMYCLCDWLFSR